MSVPKPDITLSKITMDEWVRRQNEYLISTREILHIIGVCAERTWGFSQTRVRHYVAVFVRNYILLPYEPQPHRVINITLRIMGLIIKKYREATANILDFDFVMYVAFINAARLAIRRI